MNAFHRWYCRSGRWKARVQGSILPVTVAGIDLGDNALEIGPGPGLTTDWIRQHVDRLTALEIDARLVRSLKRRLAGTNVTVVEGDAAAMPLPDAGYSSVFCLTMLHHVPYALQDKVLAESCRVLRPGGYLTGRDSTPNFVWNLYHVLDDRYPIDPAGFAARLTRAGFTDVDVQTGPRGFSFRARRPA